MEVKCPPQSLNFHIVSMLQLPTNEVQPMSRKRSELRQHVNSIARNLKLQPMCSGLVHSQGTCGLWSEDEFRDAATRSLTLTSSCSSNICRQFWRKQNRTGGQSRLGAFEMQEINFTSSMCSYSQRLSWNELLVC